MDGLRQARRLGIGLLLAGGMLAAVWTAACSPGQRYNDFRVRTPLPAENTLVLGFLGGRDSWDDDSKAVRKLALKLRAMQLPGVHVETAENTRRALALELVRQALDTDGDGALDAAERSRARIILYGQSFGGAAVVKFARQLEELDVPVLLTVQVDSVGRGDALIPANVRAAANLYQRNGAFIRGEPAIRAADPEKTVILGNFEFDYRGKPINLAGIPWYKKLARTAHTKMERDPEVWTQVEGLILAALSPQAPAE